MQPPIRAPPPIVRYPLIPAPLGSVPSPIIHPRSLDMVSFRFKNIDKNKTIRK